MEAEDKVAILVNGLQKIADGELTRSKQVDLAKSVLAKVGAGKPTHEIGLTPEQIRSRHVAKVIQEARR